MDVQVERGCPRFKRGIGKGVGRYHSLHSGNCSYQPYRPNEDHFEKDKKAAIKYQHEQDLEGFLAKKSI